MIEAGICPSEIPEKRLLDYCQRDVELTDRVFNDQRTIMEGTRLLPVVFTRCITCIVLADIERHGLNLNREAVEEEYAKTLAQSREILGKIDDFTGGINPKSPKQVGEFLYDNLGFKEIEDFRGGWSEN
jgi:DNA polymerase I-like protein with 3'-5' exonuclease and polymerase domains